MKLSNDDNIKSWEKQADFVIKNFTDEGDFYRQHLLNPSLLNLLGDVGGKKILDAGCGQGYLCRLLTKMDAKVTGVEPTKGLINYAIERDKKENTGITYIKADLSNWEDEDAYDIVVSNMVFMDIPEYQSAIINCIKSLKPGGIFVFSISHPAFESEAIANEQEDTPFQHSPNWQEHPFVKVSEYFEEYKVRNFIGYSIHRAISSYINLLIENGCRIEKLLEPQLSEELAKEYKHHERDFHIPSFLVIKAIKE
jgi:SAM-dependent methyltransferase